VIARDTSHGKTEERVYCFGEVDGGVSRCALLILNQSFESSALATGANARLDMNAKINYTNESLGRIQVVPDFLPSPAELPFREEGVKVTLALSKKSIGFFKSEATKHRTQYQRMIRRLIDAYVDGQVLSQRSSGRAKSTARRST
jgi:predicted DNA binding CopG/RHH family protein